AAALPRMPRFTQRLSTPTPRWRRARWLPVDDVDLAWHVPLVDLREQDGRPGGQAALERLVGDIAAVPLPRDRPLWRLYLVHGVEAHRAAVVYVVHHVVADGVGAVLESLHF